MAHSRQTPFPQMSADDRSFIYQCDASLHNPSLLHAAGGGSRGHLTAEGSGGERKAGAAGEHTCSTSGGNLALRSRRQCTNRPTSANTCELHRYRHEQNLSYFEMHCVIQVSCDLAVVGGGSAA